MFREMELGQLIDTTEPCRIALAYIYLDIFRTQLQIFVKNWNNHKIRTQTNRPYLVSGRPWTNYYHPEFKGGIEMGIPFSQTALRNIQEPVESYGTSQKSIKSSPGLTHDDGQMRQKS